MIPHLPILCATMAIVARFALCFITWLKCRETSAEGMQSAQGSPAKDICYTLTLSG